MKLLDEANAELCRHHDLALTAYARRLLARGADIDGEEFRADLSKYAGELGVAQQSDGRLAAFCRGDDGAAVRDAALTCRSWL